jgi:hypothetical protein
MTLRAALAEAATVRLAAHLFLTRRGVQFLVHHALRAYEPPVRLMHRVQSTGDALFVVAYGELLATLVRGPADLVLWGKGDMVLSASATEARWLHWFNVFAGAGSGAAALDSTLAVNLPALAAAGLRGALLAFYDLFGLCEDVWQVREKASIYAEQHFAVCAHRAALAALYPTGYVVTEFLAALVAALVRAVPPSAHEVALPPLVAALRARLAPKVQQPGALFFHHLDAFLGEQGEHGMETLAQRLAALADSVYASMVRPAFDALRRSAYDMGAYDMADPTAAWARTDAPPLQHYKTLVTDLLKPLQ